MNLKGRHFLTLKDYSKEEILYLVDLAKQLKDKKKQGIKGDLLEGKNIVLLFEKTSTRTRCAFEVAIHDEGGNVTYLSGSQFGKKESIKDSARVLGRMYDGIEYRGYDQKTVEDLAKYSNSVVYNGLTDVDHPTQTIADFLTISEHLNKPLNKVKFLFVGDIRNNVAYGLAYGAVKVGMDFTLLGPKEMGVDQEVASYLKEEAKKSGSTFTITSDIDEVKNMDVVYTDIWVSMGEDEHLYKERVKLLSPYKITTELMKKVGHEKTIFMHCLPSFHDFETEIAKNKQLEGLDIREVSDEVFESDYSKVFDEAENRMHSIKAILVATLGK